MLLSLGNYVYSPPRLMNSPDLPMTIPRIIRDLQMETIAAVKELKNEKDAEILQLKARVDKAEAESAQLRIFLCGQFPAAPICQP